MVMRGALEELVVPLILSLSKYENEIYSCFT